MKNFKNLLITKIKEPGEAVRSQIEFEGILELADSMKKRGLLQPIGVKPQGDMFEIEYGHRRYLAACHLGWTTIDAIILDTDDEDALHLERAHENLIRENLNPLDEAKLVYQLVYEDGRGVEAAAKMLSKSEAWISRRCDVLRWPKDIQAAIGSGEISLSVGLELQKVREEEKRIALLEAAIKHGATKRVVAQWVDDMSVDTFLKSQQADTEMGNAITSDMSEVQMECRVCGIYHGVNILRHIWLCPECLMGVRELAREVRTEIAKQKEETHGKKETE